MMRLSPLALVLALCAACPSSVSANNALVYHWPRYTTAPAQIPVIPSTDPGHALDPGYFAELQLAVNNWNLSSKVHLTVTAPAPCYWTVDTNKSICVLSEPEIPITRGGYAGLLVKTYPLIESAQMHVNTAVIPPTTGPLNPNELMILCHELGEDLGLPDPSDSPVTPTAQPTCLTRDGGMLTTVPSDANYAQLDSLYANIDPPPAPCKGKKCR